MSIRDTSLRDSTCFHDHVALPEGIQGATLRTVDTVNAIASEGKDESIHRPKLELEKKEQMLAQYFTAGSNGVLNRLMWIGKRSVQVVL
ncbi:hypothetical protein HHUSO_G17298 [Huso huso]|uniref:Uncharacterized protein n=1 Tax=Huso huso TaxID=61971 RepID=A0ABR0Z8G2_HUSHU